MHWQEPETTGAFWMELLGLRGSLEPPSGQRLKKKIRRLQKPFQFRLQYRSTENLEGQPCASKSEPLSTIQKVKLGLLFVTERTIRGANIKQNHGVSFPIKTSTTAKLFQFPLQYRCTQNLEGQLCATKSEPLTTIQKVKLALLFVTERTSKQRRQRKRKSLGFLSNQDINYCKTSQFPLQYPSIQNLEGQPCAPKSEPLSSIQKGNFVIICHATMFEWKVIKYKQLAPTQIRKSVDIPQSNIQNLHNNSRNHNNSTLEKVVRLEKVFDG